MGIRTYTNDDGEANTVIQDVAVDAQGNPYFFERGKYEVFGKKEDGSLDIGSLDFQYNDGGRSDAGYKGSTGDCVCRAVAIVTGKPYEEVYNEIIEFSSRERITKKQRTRSHPRTGVRKATTRKYLQSLGYKWVSCMGIGTGCQVHCMKHELPTGNVVLNLSGHITAVIDGVVQDTYDPCRGGTRCVYGYWINADDEIDRD